jgi:type II secretory pathway component GspD/PulD (secretin)/tetratricopeptide (TPR) repeat protein
VLGDGSPASDVRRVAHKVEQAARLRDVERASATRPTVPADWIADPDRELSMLNRDSVCVCRVLAAAGLAVSVVLPSRSAYAQSSDGTVQAAMPSASDVLQSASDLLAAGKVVRARALLIPLTSENGMALSDTERARLFAMLANANERLKRLGPIETSVQRAEEALLRDDLVEVRRHAEAVIQAPKATNEQVTRARAALEQSVRRATELAGEFEGRLSEAERDLAAGRIDSSRATLDRILHWGLTLDATQSRRLEDVRERVIAASDLPSPGMMQPGVIKRRERPAQPEPKPEEKPGVQPEQKQPEPAPQPEPKQPEQPVAQPEQKQPEAQAPQPQDDLLAQVKKFEAESLLAEADAAFEQSRLAEAAGKYDRVLRVYADVLTVAQQEHARKRLAEAQVRANVNPGQGTGVLEEWIQQNRIAHDQVVAEFNNDVEQANKALAAGDVARARDLAASANLRLNSGRQHLSQGEFEAMQKTVGDLRARIDTREDQLRAEAARIREEELAREAERKQQEFARSREEKIAQGFERARALQQEMKYEEALQVVDQILFLDPVNPTALVLRDVLQDVILLTKHQRYRDLRNRNIATHSVENTEASVPPLHILDYPEDWPAISERRGEPIAFLDTPDNRAALATLESKQVPVEFTDTPLASALAFLQTVSGLNVDVNWEALQAAGVDRDTPLNMRISKASVRAVLDRVLERAGMDSTDPPAWGVQDGIVVVATKSIINRNKTLVIYDIRDLLVEVPDYANVPEFDLQSVLQSTGQGGGSSQSPFRETGQANDRSNRRSLEDRTNELINIITTNVDPQGWQENGGDVGYIQQLQGNLIITQTPANHREIHGLLRKLRETRAMQINVETRFLLVSQDFFEQVGIDLDVYFNGRNNQVRTARATTPTTRPSDFFDFTRGGYQRSWPQPPQPGAGTNQTPLPSPLSVIGTEQNSLGIAESLMTVGFGSTMVAGAPALGVAGEFLDDIQVDFLIKATQADRRTVRLTAPRLTFTNGQTSNIVVALQESFIGDLTPVTSESAVAFDPVPAVLNTGVTLLVDGTISADRRYVTLNVVTTVTTPGPVRRIPVTAAVGGQLVTSATTQTFVELPTVNATRIQTTVTVPDQGTILLGGQRVVTEQETESGVPVLSKIPLLSRFFSNRVMAKEEQTLLILLKPTVLIQNEEEERHFPGLSESLRMP